MKKSIHLRLEPKQFYKLLKGKQKLEKDKIEIISWEKYIMILRSMAYGD